MGNFAALTKSCAASYARFVSCGSTDAWPPSAVIRLRRKQLNMHHAMQCTCLEEKSWTYIVAKSYYAPARTTLSFLHFMFILLSAKKTFSKSYICTYIIKRISAIPLPEESLFFLLSYVVTSPWTDRFYDRALYNVHLALKIFCFVDDYHILLSKVGEAIMNYTAPAGVVTWWDDRSTYGHANQNMRLIGSSAALIALSTIFVLLRLVSRKLSKAGFWVRSLCTSTWNKRLTLNGIADFTINIG